MTQRSTRPRPGRRARAEAPIHVPPAGGVAARRRSWARLWLGLAAGVLVVTGAYALLGQRFGLPLVGGGDAPRGVWGMEGGDPARTRAVPNGPAPPLDRERALLVRSDVGAGSPVAVWQGVALVEANRRLRALDLVSGEQRWFYPIDGTFASPATDGRRVYARVEADNQGRLLALDLATGKRLWDVPFERVSSAETNFLAGHLTSPVVADETVYAGAGKALYALDAATGERRWGFTTRDWLVSSPAVGGGTVYFADGGALYAVDARTGKQAWRSAVAFGLSFSPIVGADTVYARDGGKIVALNTTDGRRRWEKPVAGATLIPGALAGGTLLITATRSLLAVDAATGEERWRFEQPNAISLPAVAGSHAYVVSGAAGQRRVVALDLANGQEEWTRRMPNLTEGAPVPVGDTLYVRTTSGKLIGLSR